jgi:hypothetical protein
MSHLSSRDAKSSTTPASLRKELRHLSREISSSDVLPHAFSNRKAKAASKVTEKENFRPFNHSAAGQAWISGGGAASPAVFSFYGAPSPPKSQSLQVEPLVAVTSSIMPATSVEKSRSNQSYTSTSNMWMPGSVVPRGLMVQKNSQKSHFFEGHIRFFAAHQLPRDFRCSFSSCWNFVLLARSGVADDKVCNMTPVQPWVMACNELGPRCIVIK